MHIVWLIVFLLAILIAWFTNILGLPGNWLMLACAVAYWYLQPPESSLSISLTLLVVLAVLAALGELLELFASSAGVSKAGGSRRSALFAILGSVAGAVVGFGVGFPIPVIGPVVASVLFGSLGAMAGAAYSEWSAGRNWKQTLTVGKAAFWGRALGTIVKMAVGLIMICVAIAGIFL